MSDETWFETKPIKELKLFEKTDILQFHSELAKAHELLAAEHKLENLTLSMKASDNAAARAKSSENK